MTDTQGDAPTSFAGALGDILRAEREHRGLTRADLENRTGMSRSNYQRIENGSKAPDVDELRVIIDAINALDRPGFPDVVLGDVIIAAEVNYLRGRKRETEPVVLTEEQATATVPEVPLTTDTQRSIRGPRGSSRP